MIRHAFKEWAVICKVLAEGRQALILRKGGIAERFQRFYLERVQELLNDLTQPKQK